MDTMTQDRLPLLRKTVHQKRGVDFTEAVLKGLFHVHITLC